MQNSIYQFLDDLGTQEFINVLMEVSETILQDKILTDVDDVTSEDQMLSSKTVLDLIDAIKEIISNLNSELDNVQGVIADIPTWVSTEYPSALNTLEIEFVTGSIEDKIPDPKSNVLYFQHDDESDNTWVLYIYNGEWKRIGETKYELLNYWSKDELDDFVEKFYQESIDLLTDDEIKMKTKKAYESIIEKK